MELKIFIKGFCEFLRKHALEIINFKQKKMKLLTKKQQQIICYFYKETFENKYLKDKAYCKVGDYYIYTGQYKRVAHSTCNLKYSVPKKCSKIFIMDLIMMMIIIKEPVYLESNLLVKEKRLETT